MWLVGLVYKWEGAFEVDKTTMIPFFPMGRVNFTGDSYGFCEVFDDYDKALTAAGGDAERVWPVVAKPTAKSVKGE